MEKDSAHTRKVGMPGPKPDQSAKPQAAGGPFGIDFGFGKQQQPAGQATPQQSKPASLDDAYQFWKKNPDAGNMRRLLDVARPVIDKAITSYAGGDPSFKGHAKKLAIDAFRTFSPTKGAKLRTHLLIRLQPLRRAYTKRLSPLAVPERVQLDKMRIDQTEQAFTQLHGREPSDAELAEETGLSLKRISHVKAFAGGSLSEGRMVIEGEQMLPGSNVVTPEDIVVEFVHHDLDPVDKKILEWKTGLYGKRRLTTGEIARRLKITPSAVSQRAAKIALKLEAARTRG